MNDVIVENLGDVTPQDIPRVVPYHTNGSQTIKAGKPNDGRQANGQGRLEQRRTHDPGTLSHISFPSSTPMSRRDVILSGRRKRCLKTEYQRPDCA